MPPAATPPPLATAAADIMEEATDPAAMPAEVKPAAVSRTGAATTRPASKQVESKLLHNASMSGELFRKLAHKMHHRVQYYHRNENECGVFE